MKLKINQKEYGLQWGMGAIEIFCDTMDCDIDGLEKAITSEKSIDKLKAINNLSLAAIQNWCELNNVDFDLSYRQFQNWLSDQPQETGNSIIENWKASKIAGKTIAEYYFGELPPDTDIKKKQPRSGKS